MPQSVGLGGDDDDDPIDREPRPGYDHMTGFEPEQLTAYPLQRVGRTLYVASIEAVSGSTGGNAIMIDADAMTAYNVGRKTGPQAEHFASVPVTYSVPMPDPGQEVYGAGELVIDDLEPHLEEHPAVDADDTDIVSVLVSEEPEDELHRISRVLEDDVLAVEVQEGPQRPQDPRYRQRTPEEREHSGAYEQERTIASGS